jgi:hypothetical protein
MKLRASETGLRPGKRALSDDNMEQFSLNFLLICSILELFKRIQHDGLGTSSSSRLSY